MGSLHERLVSRRDLVVSLATGVVAACAAPVMGSGLHARERSRPQELGRLTTRYRPPRESLEPGVHALGIERGRDGVLYLPPQYRTDTPITLVLLLHGAGGAGSRMAQRFKPYADELGMAFLAPDSREISWDRADRLTKDVAFIDEALAVAYRRINTIPDRLRIAGFSDGASYSLSVGLTNGDLFGRILALSPGFVDNAQERGTPSIYITHGTNDDILPIERTSRRIVPMLQRNGYSVEYHEFEGKHETPPEVTRPAFDWLLKS
jgi:phospholipase/carboxylesterase